MKRYAYVLFTLIVSISLCVAPTANAALSVVQAANCARGGSGTVNCAVSSTGAGSIIVVSVAQVNNGAPTVGDNKGSTYTQEAKGCYSDQAHGCLYLFDLINATSGITNVSTTQTGGNGFTSVVYEISGAATSNAIDGTATGTASAYVSTSTCPIPNQTTTNANDIIVGACQEYYSVASPTFTDVSPWTTATNGKYTGGTGQYDDIMYRIVTSTGSYTPTVLFTPSSGVIYESASIAYKQSAGAGSPPTPNPMSFATVPYGASTTSITMVATTSALGSGDTAPLQYVFNSIATSSVPAGCTNPGTGGASSTQAGTSYTNSGLQTNKCYAYTVLSEDSEATPATTTPSATSSAYTLANAPGTPTLASTGTSTLSFSNNSNSNPSNTQYAIFVSSTSPTDSLFNGFWIDSTGHGTSSNPTWITSSSLPATLSTLQPNTTYTIKVEAENGDSVTTTLSSAGSATTNTGVPGTPTYSGQTSSTPGNVTVNWTAPAGSVSYYNLDNATSANGTYGFVVSTTATSSAQSGLSANTTYWYEVQSVNGSGATSSFSATSSVLTYPNQVSSAPTVPNLTGTSLTLNWIAPTGGGDYYNIATATSSNGTYTTVASSSATSSAVGGLTANTSYWFKVQAANSTGGGLWSPTSTMGTAGLCLLNGENANYALGQSIFTTNASATTQTGLSTSYDVAYDGGSQRLFVADGGNNRVMVFGVGTSSISMGEGASYVLGQSSFTASSSATTQAGLSTPRGVAYDPTYQRLFVADTSNNRVLVFNVATATIANNETSTNVLGQTDFVSSGATTTQAGLSAPSAVSYDAANSRLFVADTSNNRVLVFNVATATISNNENASYVLGQANYTSSTATTTQTGMSGPAGLGYDPTTSRLFVSDKTNSRTLVFDASVGTIANGEGASKVLGQTSFTTTNNTAATSSLSGPGRMDVDTSRQLLFVPDDANRRVMVFSIATSTITNGENASYVIGQADFSGASSNVAQGVTPSPVGSIFDSTNTRLFVAGNTTNRILEFPVGGCSNYVATGTLDSATFDTGVASGTALNSFMWQGTLPLGTSVGFQFAVSNSSSGSWTYYGLNGDTSSYFTGQPNTSISLKTTNPLPDGRSFFSGYRYFRYRATLYADSNQSYTPVVTRVTVNWSP